MPKICENMPKYRQFSVKISYRPSPPAAPALRAPFLSKIRFCFFRFFKTCPTTNCSSPQRTSGEFFLRSLSSKDFKTNLVILSAEAPRRGRAGPIDLPVDPSVSIWGVERRGKFSPLGPLAGCFLALGSGLGLVGTVSARR